MTSTTDSTSTSSPTDSSSIPISSPTSSPPSSAPVMLPDQKPITRQRWNYCFQPCRLEPGEGLSLLKLEISIVFQVLKIWKQRVVSKVNVGIDNHRVPWVTRFTTVVTWSQWDYCTFRTNQWFPFPSLHTVKSVKRGTFIFRRLCFLVKLMRKSYHEFENRFSVLNKLEFTTEDENNFCRCHPFSFFLPKYTTSLQVFPDRMQTVFHIATPWLTEISPSVTVSTHVPFRHQIHFSSQSLQRHRHVWTFGLRLLQLDWWCPWCALPKAEIVLRPGWITVWSCSVVFSNIRLKSKTLFSK